MHVHNDTNVTMTGYNPEDLNEQAENAEVPEGKAVITEVNETVASSVYGDVDFDYDPTKKMIEVVANPNIEDDEIDEITDTFALPESDASWHNPNFKLAQFREQYGTVPKEDMEVSISVNEETGMIEIDY